MEKSRETRKGSQEKSVTIKAIITVLTFMALYLPKEIISKLRQSMDELWKQGVPPDQMKIMLMDQVKELRDEKKRVFTDQEFQKKPERRDSRGDKLKIN